MHELNAATDASLADLLLRQLELWRPGAEEKGFDLRLALDQDLPERLSFDVARVQQCVSALVSSAIGLAGQGRVEIIVVARKAIGGRLIEIRVRAAAMELDAETLSRLQGGDLGLSMVRRLAELMGGGATATSEPGRGAILSFSFHAGFASQAGEAAAAEAIDAGGARSSLRLSHIRVLLVDGHAVNRQVASLFLKPLNIRVVEAANGEEALAALARQAFDLVLLDMNMPVMDGPATLRRIRESRQPWAAIPVIALTADALSGDRETYLAMGMNGHLSKPLAERELLSEIVRAHSGSATLSQAA